MNSTQINRQLNFKKLSWLHKVTWLLIEKDDRAREEKYFLKKSRSQNLFN
jgi:hypothetical protein